MEKIKIKSKYMGSYRMVEYKYIEYSLIQNNDGKHTHDLLIDALRAHIQ
jgi:hypothetical protein